MADPAPGPSRAWADRVRHVIAAPDPSDGLPAFLPYLDADGNEVWVERAQLTPAQWRRVRAWVLDRLKAELG